MASRKYYSEDARNRAQVERSILAAVCLILGIAVGTVVALLFAPEEGENLRQSIAERTSNLREQAEDKVKELAS